MRIFLLRTSANDGGRAENQRLTGICPQSHSVSQKLALLSMGYNVPAAVCNGEKKSGSRACPLPSFFGRATAVRYQHSVAKCGQCHLQLP